MDASEQIDALIAGLPDWRGKLMAKLRRIIREADPQLVEGWKWMGTPVWSRGGIVCLANPFKDKVKVTFQEGANVPDPDNLYNNGLGGSKWRSIDFFEGDKIRETELANLVRSAVAYNLAKPQTKTKSKPKAKSNAKKTED